MAARKKKLEPDSEPQGSCRHSLGYDDCPYGCPEFYDQNGYFDLSSDDDDAFDDDEEDDDGD